MTHLDPDLKRLGDALHASATIDAAREERASRPAVAGPGRHADGLLATRPRRTFGRPRILAGSTLGLAGVGAALVLALGGSAAPAYAITRTGDGSVLVKLDYLKNQDLPQVNQKLAAMGTGEQITIYMARGSASVSGAVTCTAAPGVSGPTVKVLDGANGTEVIGAGQSAGNTAEGTFHLARCVTTSATGSGNSGTTGNTGG